MSREIPIFKFSNFLLKKQNKYYELPLGIYNSGIKKIKERLLELYPSKKDLINNIYYLFSLSKILFSRNDKSLVINAASKKNLKLLIDENILTDSTTLITNWFKILGAIVSLKASEAQQFWNNQCEENSKKLWFPTATDSVDSPLSYSNGFSLKTIQNSWFLTKQLINPVAKSYPKMFSPLYKFSPNEKWDHVGIRAIKLKLELTKSQQLTLTEWANTTRYVYNKCLEKIKNNPKLNSVSGYASLNKSCITVKDNRVIQDWLRVTHGHERIVRSMDEAFGGRFLYEWELNTPKDIRYGALRDIKKAYKTAWANLTAGNINHFGLEFRKRKRNAQQSMELSSNATYFTGDGLRIYPSYTDNSTFKFSKDGLKFLQSLDKSQFLQANNKLKKFSRLKQENGEWYLCLSYDVKDSESNKKEKTCAIDPGVRDFVVIYSEDKVIIISVDKVELNRIYYAMDKLKSDKEKNLVRQRTYDKIRCRLQARLSHLIDDLHYKVIAFLTKNYTSILLPSFETQNMVSKLHRKTSRNLMNFAFYKFQQRLKHKCSIIKNCNVTIVNEAYTSKTCGICGNQKKTPDKIITCKKCNTSFDRDVNGSRNIYLKHVSMTDIQRNKLLLSQV
jgi:IS605 OrfB family transposase